MLYNVVKILLSFLIACLIPFGWFFSKHRLLAQEYSNFIDETNERLKAGKEDYQAIVAGIVAKFQENSAKLDSNKIEQILTITPINQHDVQTSNQTINTTTCLEEKQGFWIFISFSMPNTLITNYAKIAEKIGAKLVIRGLKNNSFKEMIEYIQKIEGQGLKIAIYPQVFKQFQVNYVPSFVLSDGKSYDKLTGNLSLAYVLDSFTNKGELQQEAKDYLRRLDE